jgi:ATP-binding protein involved in chromosome partitioning
LLKGTSLGLAKKSKKKDGVFMAFVPPGGNPFDRQQKIEGIKKIIAVGAGKGGVGKSTVATNLAMALSLEGKKIGLLDADIYGPSIPKMMGLGGMQPNVNSQKKIEPLVAHGMKTMSIGYLVDDKSAIIWRGPMLFKAIDQFLRDVDWGDLDFLIVDLPPGTGDVQLSLVQKVPVDGAIIVSTPQDMALIDVKRCVDMFERVRTPILGIIENMTSFVCPHCKHESDLYPKGELHKFSEEKQISILAQIPFTSAIANAAETGKLTESQNFTAAAKVLISKFESD